MQLDVAKSRRTKIYKEISDENADRAISSYIGTALNDIANEPRQYFRFEDSEKLKQLIIKYLEACERNSVFPSVAGLMRVAGMHRQSFYDYLRRHPETESGRLMQIFHDACAEVLQQASLRNQCNVIASIFVQKAVYDLHESIEVLAPKPDPLGERTMTPAEIAEKYSYLPGYEDIQQ